MEFTCKSKICVFCGNSIEEEGSYLTEESVGKNTFLQGVNLIVRLLNVSWEAETDWGLMNDEFVGMLCCQECYRLLEKVVSLDQLIMDTQVNFEIFLGWILAVF